MNWLRDGNKLSRLSVRDCPSVCVFVSLCVWRVAFQNSKTFLAQMSPDLFPFCNSGMYLANLTADLSREHVSVQTGCFSSFIKRWMDSPFWNEILLLFFRAISLTSCFPPQQQSTQWVSQRFRPLSGLVFIYLFIHFWIPSVYWLHHHPSLSVLCF